MNERRPILTLAERIRLYRNKQRWRIADVAAAAGVRYVVWRRLERGEPTGATERERRALRPYVEAAEALPVSDGELARIIRLRLGFSLSLASARTGVPKMTLRRIEGGTSDASEYLYKLREIYYS